MSEYLPVAEQLNILFEVLTRPDGRPYTLKEVSDATGVSLATLSQMRNGKILNPQLNTLRDLCVHFNVPLQYFGTRSRDECYDIIQGEQTPTKGINEIAFRAARLSEGAQRDILIIIEWMQMAEQAREKDKDLPPLPHLERYDDD